MNHHQLLPDSAVSHSDITFGSYQDKSLYTISGIYLTQK